MGRILIKGGTVLGLDRKIGNLPEGDVLVEDGRITEVGQKLRARGAETIDATQAIIMPGFVDGHRHAWKSLLRNAGDLVEPAAVADRLRPDDVYAATLIALLGAAEAGVTTVVDWADLPHEPSLRAAALQAHGDAGIRTIYVHPGPAHELASSETPPTTTLAVGTDDPTGPSLDDLAAAWTEARNAGRRIHSHAGTSASRDAIASLGKRDLLGADVSLVHGSKLSDPDLDAIAASSTGLVLTPSAEMATGLGPPPVQQLIDREIRPGLGVEDDRLGPGDVFAQMREVISIQHATSFDLKLAGKGGVPRLLTTRDTIRYGTIDGARAIGLEGVTGSLSVGKQADIIVLRTDRPNIFPINDPIGAVVWGMDTSNLDWVLVAGEPVLRDGRLVADTARVRALAADARRHVVGGAGLEESIA